MILLIILALGVLLYYTWPRLLMWALKRQFAKAQRQAEAFRQQYAGAQRQRPAQKRRRAKIISRDVGEYVEFEDLPGRPGDGQEQKEVKYTVESQVTDVEWEDL